MTNVKQPEVYRAGTPEDVVSSLAMAEAQRQSKQEAREALIKARDVGVRGTKNLNRNKRRTDALVADLEPMAHEPEVASLLERIRRDPACVDSRELHYIQRRYQDGEALSSADEMDALYRRILSDQEARLYRKGGVRYQVRSLREGWNAIFDPDGTRVSLYPDLDDDFGEMLWTLNDLIR